VLFALVILNSQLSTASAQTTAFTYQGQLVSGAGNANGSYDMTFAVWSASVAGSFIAGPVTNTAVAVSNGLFTVTLDFGAGIFTGTNYFVEMGVRTNGGGAFATLVPRQQLTPAPAAFSLAAQSPQASALCPPGAVMAYMGTTAPNGWLLCDGSTNSRIIYAALFAVIGTNCGSGNGSTTFNLPDLRGRFLRGVDSGAGRDPDAASRTAMNSGGSSGNAVGTIQPEKIRTHNHIWGASTSGNLYQRQLQSFISSGGSLTTILQPNIAGSVTSSGGGDDDYFNVADFGGGAAATFYTSPNSTIEQGTGETRPINAYVNYIIKY
jgi:microcystin-dependent protein